MKVELKSITPNAEINIVEIARVSSSRKDKSEKPEGLIKYLLANKHFSPFEHSYLTFEIITSKAIGIQLLRHKSCAFQEFSTRYSKVENFEPFEIRKQAEKNRQSSTDAFDPMISLGNRAGEDWSECASRLIEKHLDATKLLYERLLSAGVAKECARMILPLCTETTIFMTGNIRSWIHFLDLRDEEHSQLEIQLIAREIKKIFKEQLPIISAALEY